MSSQPSSATSATSEHDEHNENIASQTLQTSQREPGVNEMFCPVCGSAMPDLKGGKATICPNCGFKDSCCF